MKAKSAKTERKRTERACPLCGYQFKGNGFAGIDRHWRARHERIMAYAEAWPLIKAETHKRRLSNSWKEEFHRQMRIFAQRITRGTESNPQLN
jgi:hypothetical protein